MNQLPIRFAFNLWRKTSEKPGTASIIDRNQSARAIHLQMILITSEAGEISIKPGRKIRIPEKRILENIFKEERR